MWIRHVAFSEATGRLRQLFERIRGPGDAVDAIMLAHSLRPHTMEGHMTLYKAVLHHTENRVPKWFLETLGVYVSRMNKCDYCVQHHSAGLKRLVGDRHAALMEGLANIDEGPFTRKEKAALQYAATLTVAPATLTSVDALREAGYDDAEILEINQVAAYFAYANRTVLGLGCSTKNDILGLSPSSDSWNHN